MPKTPKRFSIRRCKTCWRNNCIAGNPVERSFETYAVVDKNWEHDNWCGRGVYKSDIGAEYYNQHQDTRKFRRICDTKELAQKIADEMNRIWNENGCPAQIKFNDVYGTHSEWVEMVALNKEPCELKTIWI